MSLMLSVQNRMLRVLSRRSLSFRPTPLNCSVLPRYSKKDCQCTRIFKKIIEVSTQYHPTFDTARVASFSTTSSTAMTTPSNIDLQALGENSVKMVPSMQPVKLGTLWKDSTSVIIFLRRFGCVFCRQSAMEISKILPLLKENNVRLFAVGLEEFGYEEFVKENYFKGDLYIDIDEASYKQIGYKKYGTIGVLMSLFNKKARDAIAKSKSEGTSGNLRGNGLQTGGVIIGSDGGTKILMDYRQDNPADHVANSEILKVLGIADTLEKDTASATN